MKKTKKLIDLHKEWMGMGTMGEPENGGGGLCNVVPVEYKTNLCCFIPKQYRVFWGSDTRIGSTNENYKTVAYKYTELRQTIVLFICAMHNEL